MLLNTLQIIYWGKISDEVYKFICGIGGIRSGLEKNGHECVAFCEIDKFARQSYKAK